METKKRATRKKVVKPEPEAVMTDRERIIINKFDGPLPYEFRSLGKWNARLLNTELRYDGYEFDVAEIQNTLKKFGKI